MMDFELIGYNELLSMGNGQYYGHREGKFYHICGNSSTDNIHIAQVDRYDVIEEVRFVLSKWVVMLKDER